MSAVIMQEQVIVDNATPTDEEFFCTGPFKIASTGAFTLKTWNGAAYMDALGEVIISPKFVACGGKYAVSAAGAVTISITPLKG